MSVLKLLVLGAGQLGSRHLQALVKSKFLAEIYVVDPDENSLSVSKERCDATEFAREHTVHYSTSFNEVAVSQFDFVVIATSSKVRFKALKELISKFKVKYLLLEKFLFPKESEYTDARLMLEQHNVKAWVNCPLRMYPFYQHVKEHVFNTSAPYEYEYVGGEWIGLASNAIHYIDHLSYLSDEQVMSVDVDALDKQVLHSKRVGYVDFSGTLRVSYSGGSTLTITSIKGSDQSSEISIKQSDTKLTICELSGKYSLFKEGEPTIDSEFKVPFQSELTNLVLEELVEHGNCKLSTFSDSEKLHLHFLSPLLKKYQELIKENVDTLPIT